MENTGNNGNTGSPPAVPAALHSHSLPAPRRRPRSPLSPKTLYAQNLGLTFYCLARFPFLSPQQREDAESAALIGLWHAAQRFDPARGLSFSSYACDCIRGTILRHLRTEKRQGRLDTVALETPIGDEGSELADIVADPNAEKPGAALCEDASFEALLTGLPERQRELLRAVYRENKPLAEVGEAWGMSRARASQIHLQALSTLRKSKTLRRGLRTRSPARPLA